MLGLLPVAKKTVTGGKLDRYRWYRTELEVYIIDKFKECEKITSCNSMIAVSKIFARAKKQMNVFEYKAVVFALTKVRWKEETPSDIVYCDKKELANFCGVHSDSKHLSQHLKEKIGQLQKNSFIEISSEDTDFESGSFITEITMLTNIVRIKFNDEYLGLFTNLKSGEYITLWADDLLGVDNSESGRRAITLYEYLRLHSDTRKTNKRGLCTKELKEMWNIPKDGKGSYMLKNGHFDRSKFEQKVLEPVLEKLTKCKMINLVIQSDGKLYEKVKEGNKALEYRLFWTISDRPAVVSAKEKKEVNEAIEKNPAVLKLAKDIVYGEKKKKEEGKGSPQNFIQRDYGNIMAEIERALLK